MLGEGRVSPIGMTSTTVTALLTEQAATAKTVSNMFYSPHLYIYVYIYIYMYIYIYIHVCPY